MKPVVLVLLVGALFVGCPAADGDGGRTLPDEDCGFPTPTPGTPETRVPEEFLIDGSRISFGQKVRGGFVTSIAIPYSVQDGLPIYRAAVTEAGFEIRNEDNEGFEAEIYFERSKELGAIQIRRSTCPDASLVFVNIVTRRSLSQPGTGFD